MYCQILKNRITSDPYHQSDLYYLFTAYSEALFPSKKLKNFNHPQLLCGEGRKVKNRVNTKICITAKKIGPLSSYSKLYSCILALFSNFSN